MTDTTPEKGLSYPEIVEQALNPAPAGARPTNQTGRGEPVRTVRVSDPLWDAVTKEAQRSGVPTATIVRDALDAYLDRRP